MNALLALETAKKLNDMGYIIREEAIERGLRLAICQGRFEKISRSPDIYIDGAHNRDAAISLRESIELYFTNRRLIFMIGVLADKDYKSIIRIPAPLADVIITLTPDNLGHWPLRRQMKSHCSKVIEKEMRVLKSL